MVKAEVTKTSKLNVFKAPSDCALVEITTTAIKIAVGKDISPKIYQHILGLAMSHQKRLQLVQCESLSNLNKIDKLVEMFNQEYALYI